MEIPLSRGLHAIIDDGDFARVSRFKWHAVAARRTFYAATRVGRKTIYMHRLILGIEGCGREVFVDHANGDGLDNRRLNIRECTHAENMQKRVSNRNPIGGRGIYKHGKRYVARIGHAGKYHYLGIFRDQSAAQAAYDDAAATLFGAFAPPPTR